MYAKSSVLTLPLLNRRIVFSFEEETTTAFVQAVSNEYLEILANPGEGDKEFYGELYFDDYGAWKLLKIID